MHWILVRQITEGVNLSENKATILTIFESHKDEMAKVPEDQRAQLD